jgi:VWFA-related protein
MGKQKAESRKQKTSRRAAGFCFLLSALCFARAEAQVRETVSVHLVEVPVIVTDRDGNPIRDLTAANFEVYDESKKRDISTFDKIDFSSPESLKSTSPLNPALRRSFLLLFDMSFSSPSGRSKAQEAARNFIARGLQKRDLAAIATVDVERGFRLLTSFTTDRNLLTAAISNPRLFISADPLQIAGSDVMEMPKPSDANANNADVNAITEYQAEIARLEKRLNDSYNRGRVERQITQLGGIARTLRMLPGRKQVVFFSEGFDARLVQGRDARAMADSLSDMDLVIHGEAFKTDSDARYGNSTTLSILEGMAKQFRGSDVVLHSVDIAGVRVHNDIQKGVTLKSNEGLYLVSNATGGEVFQNSNDMNADMERMLRRQEVVYVLGFQTSSTDASKFHTLKVRVSGVQKAVRVQHRAGYWESVQQNAVERMLTTAEIVLNDIPQEEIAVAALAVPFPTAPKRNAQVPVIVEIKGDDVLKNAKPGALDAEIYVYAFDEEGVVRDRMFQRMNIDSAKAGDKLRESGIKYYATLSLPEGTYAIKTLVRVPQTERKGYARVDIVVPKIDDVAVLPPMFVEEPGRWLMVKGGSHDETNAGYPFEINGESFIPSASVLMKKGEPREFAVFVYNATPEEVAWEATLRDGMGLPRPANASLLRQSQHEDVTKMMFRYAADDAPAGASSLGFTVRKKGSSDARQASVRLSVQR